ncbi:MAG TPA: hypothetical protein VHP38_17560 [Ruminiclostridium sp.]|nr:hypothetical protein [Ruminiclostridium sp.]
MKLSRKQRLTIIVVIAGLLILYGILDKIFKFNFNPKTVSNVGMVLMILAFALLFSDNRRSGGSDNNEAAAKDEKKDDGNNPQ